MTQGRALLRITLNFGISYSIHFWQVLKRKGIEIVYYYCDLYFLISTKLNPIVGAKNVKLFFANLKQEKTDVQVCK